MKKVVRKPLLERGIKLLQLAISGKLPLEINECKQRLNGTLDCFRGIQRTDNLNQRTENISISVVIPTKNEAKRIILMLKSLNLGRCKNVEAIVVDYMSTDGTAKIAQSLGAKVVSVTEKGVGFASHMGVINCLGEIVVRTDADAIFPSSLLPLTAEAFRTDGNLKLYHAAHLYYDGNIVENLMAHFYDKYWRDLWKTTGQFIAFRRNAYSNVGEFDVKKRVGEDFDFGLRAFRNLGAHSIRFDFNNIVLVSSRRIKSVRLANYVLGRFAR